MYSKNRRGRSRKLYRNSIIPHAFEMNAEQTLEALFTLDDRDMFRVCLNSPARRRTSHLLKVMQTAAAKYQALTKLTAPADESSDSGGDEANMNGSLETKGLDADMAMVGLDGEGVCVASGWTR